jgi:hypothetical protein
MGDQLVFIDQILHPFSLHDAAKHLCPKPLN